ncbi:hypothetical protein [Flagellimonas flava]|uniref:Uncharacterized protein n=1 Tax=Flagellimonas flava TaxID=570519 RepID=A0A1M5N7Q7_9FLAO|nr:hypothetical protein [Allomuricauda flava]SHG85505.1 hypothetical protein SAMN04488116_2702 [Allomuricauda flava]
MNAKLKYLMAIVLFVVVLYIIRSQTKIVEEFETNLKLDNDFEGIFVRDADTLTVKPGNDNSISIK